MYELRRKIDAIDDEIVGLFSERLRVCADVAKHKAQHGIPVHDPDREAHKLDSVIGKTDEDLRGYMQELYHRIFQLSREYQEKLTVQPVDRDARSRGKFGLLGERLGHSFSPMIHGMLAGYEYELYEKQPEEVGDFLKNSDFDGLNVTMPYKKTVLQLCATLSDAATRTGSVNTVIRGKDGSLHGDNTDYFGFLHLLGRLGARVEGRKALVLGSGGAAATVRAVLGDLGAGEIVTISRSGADNYGNIGRHRDAQVVVNATPVGMYPRNGETPVDLELFGSCEAVFDLVSNPVKTELILQAEDRGIPCAGGLMMLVAQAARAYELFTSEGLPDEVVHKLAESVGQKVRNIALIGMPGCGKSTVGRCLAELMRREFHDTDEIVDSGAGMSIERIFIEHGEAAFRDMEEAALREVSKKCGCVIATGGGVVTREANRRLLRQNSVIVFLDRPPDGLPVEGRPLSALRGAQNLYSERAPLYTEWGEHRVAVCGDPMKTAQAVLDAVCGAQVRN